MYGIELGDVVCFQLVDEKMEEDLEDDVQDDDSYCEEEFKYMKVTVYSVVANINESKMFFPSQV